MNEEYEHIIDFDYYYNMSLADILSNEGRITFSEHEPSQQFLDPSLFFGKGNIKLIPHGKNFIALVKGFNGDLFTYNMGYSIYNSYINPGTISLITAYDEDYEPIPSNFVNGIRYTVFGDERSTSPTVEYKGVLPPEFEKVVANGTIRPSTFIPLSHYKIYEEEDNEKTLAIYLQPSFFGKKDWCVGGFQNFFTFAFGYDSSKRPFFGHENQAIGMYYMSYPMYPKDFEYVEYGLPELISSSVDCNGIVVDYKSFSDNILIVGYYLQIKNWLSDYTEINNPQQYGTINGPQTSPRETDVFITLIDVLGFDHTFHIGRKGIPDKNKLWVNKALAGYGGHFY